MIFHDEGRFNLRSYLKKKSYYSRGFAAYIAKWGKSNLEIKKQFGLRYRYLGVFLENGKWRRLLAHPLLAGGCSFCGWWWELSSLYPVFIPGRNHSR